MNDLCFLDLETTGFEPGEDSIIEVSFVRYVDGKLVAEMDQVCLPDKSPLNPTVTQITGITQEEIDRDGKLFAQILPLLQEKIGKESAIVGHNIDFDLKFLKANGVDLSHNKRLDTHELARILLVGEESYALEILSQKYGFTHENAHRAMSDVLASKDLLEFLLVRIPTLPQEYLEAVQPVLEKSAWDAKAYFLNIKENLRTAASLELKNSKTKDISENSQVLKFSSSQVGLPQANSPLLLRISHAQESAETLLGITQAHPDQKFFIVTDKLRFFPRLPRLEAPGNLLDPQRLDDFITSRENPTDSEITFYLKLKLREHLGILAQQEVDLFFAEKPWWREICLEDGESGSYQTYLNKKLEQRVILLTHQDFLQLISSDILSSDLLSTVLLLVDEGENFVRKTLFRPSRTHSLWPYLESSDKDLATRTHFFVTHFCRQVLEKTLEHQINPFPLRLRLPETAYEKLSQVALEISDDQTITEFAEILRHPENFDLRWAHYNPGDGFLSLSTWNKKDWETLLKRLARIPTILTHRHNLESVHRNSEDGEALDFFQVFYNPQCQLLTAHCSLLTEKPTIPEDLMAATSPDYPEYCAQKILETFEEYTDEKGGWIAVNFSSVTTMRAIYEILVQKLEGREDVSLLGERISGGEGKLTQILRKKTDQKGILLYQSFLDPVLSELDFRAVMLQKFPFPFPHPLTEHLEGKLSGKNLSFWDLWTLPFVATKLSRNLSGFAKPLPLIVIDPRENSKWAKNVWKLLR